MRIKRWVIPYIFLCFCGLLMSQFSYGVDYEASNSTNAIASSTLIVIPLTDPGDVLQTLLINTRATAAETIKIYDSSGTATNLIGTVDLSSGVLNTISLGRSNEYHYGLRLSSACTITKSGSSSDLTILWKNVR